MKYLKPFNENAQNEYILEENMEYIKDILIDIQDYGLVHKIIATDDIYQKKYQMKIYIKENEEPETPNDNINNLFNHDDEDDEEEYDEYNEALQFFGMDKDVANVILTSLQSVDRYLSSEGWVKFDYKNIFSKLETYIQTGKDSINLDDVSITYYWKYGVNK